MTHPLEPESIDLAEVVQFLQRACGPSVVGAIVGRTRIRDAVCAHLACSELEAEMVVDTMVGRGFLKQRTPPGGLTEWAIG